MEIKNKYIIKKIRKRGEGGRGEDGWICRSLEYVGFVSSMWH